MLAIIKKNANGRRNRISTADLFLRTLGKCSGGLCPTDRARYTGAEFEKRVKEASQIPVYENDAMNFIAWTKSGLKAAEGSTLAPCASFEAVYTSQKQDRDSDVLEPAGCEVDPRMPLLWQHDSTLPIGAHRETLAQDKVKVLGRSEIADTVLGRDAAYLAEFGALRISHGFRPCEFEPMTEKSGGEDIIVGFHVLKYEMMEVSLVSVPSNTDAVIQAFSRGKLASPHAKSWGAALDSRRQKMYTTGWGIPAFRPKAGTTVVNMKTAPKTGKAKPLVARKDAAEFEKALADACGQIKHSGDYGLCFYKAGDTADTFAVWWTMGDADTPDNTDETGTPYTSEDDIKSLLGAVPSVASVELGSEQNPPQDEGWREVFPEVRDWVSGDGNKPQPAQDGDAAPAAPPASGSDDSTGKGKRGKGAKADAPVAGSAEHVGETLGALASDYLAQNGVAVDGMTVTVEATFPDNVVLCVGTGKEGEPNTYYQVPYTMTDGTPAFSGPPVQVELTTTVDSAPAAGGTDPNANPPATPSATGGDPPAATPAGDDTGKGKKPVRKWTPVKKTKGKLGKKDTGMLKEAAEHLDDAMSRDGMPTVCKTLVRRASELLGEVMKSEGASTDNDGDGSGQPQPGAPAMLAEEERRLWALAAKMAGNKNVSKTALAAVLTELATTLEQSDVAQLLKSLK